MKFHWLLIALIFFSTLAHAIVVEPIDPTTGTGDPNGTTQIIFEKLNQMDAKINNLPTDAKVIGYQNALGQQLLIALEEKTNLIILITVVIDVVIAVGAMAVFFLFKSWRKI